MEPKYRLLKSQKVKIDGVTLYRVKALRSFSIVQKGDKGGYIQSVKNLSQHGNAWVFNNARVFNDARVSGNAWVFNNAQVFNDAWVSGNAWVFNNARVSGNAHITR